MHEPEWVNEARTHYAPQISDFSDGYPTETNMLRGSMDVEVLREHIIGPQTRKLNVCVVGLGYMALDNVCPYEPYQIAAYLEQAGVDYQLVLVDNNARIIRDVSSRTKLFMSVVWESSIMQWNEYLAWTGQIDRVTAQPEDGLVLSSYTLDDLTYHNRTPDDVFRKGFHVAACPKTFRQKMVAGDITLLNEDIAGAGLPKAHFDYAACKNVLMYLPLEGQMLAMYNLACCLAPGGILSVNESFGRQPLTVERGGWLDARKLEQLELRIKSTTFHEGVTPKWESATHILMNTTTA